MYGHKARQSYCTVDRMIFRSHNLSACTGSPRRAFHWTGRSSSLERARFRLSTRYSPLHRYSHYATCERTTDVMKYTSVAKDMLEQRHDSLDLARSLRSFGR